MEGVIANTARLVGTDYDKIYDSFKELLNNDNVYNEMAHSVNPYGDGTAAKKIIDIIENEFK